MGATTADSANSEPKLENYPAVLPEQRIVRRAGVAGTPNRMRPGVDTPKDPIDAGTRAAPKAPESTPTIDAAQSASGPDTEPSLPTVENTPPPVTPSEPEPRSSNTLPTVSRADLERVRSERQSAVPNVGSDAPAPFEPAPDASASGTGSRPAMRPVSRSPIPTRNVGDPVPTPAPQTPKREDFEAPRRKTNDQEATQMGGEEPVSPDELEARENYRADPNPALAETQDMDPVEAAPPSAPNDGPRVSFGQAAVSLKIVTPEQISECVNLQRAMAQKGQRVPLLGQILLKRGYLKKPDVERIKSHQQMHQMADKISGYRLTERLGQGAMGTVYKAMQVRMERWVAIKILQPELAANAKIKQRFLHEARSSARLNHPNVITGIDAGEESGLCYFAMEYVEGKTLAQLVRERGAFDERQALEITLQLGKALEHAEKHNIVHRDVKPDNAMLTRERVAKLLDLGLAKVRADGDSSTQGMAVGTPNYISPEQAMGKTDIDTRADIYSLGVTLFYILTARVPFEGPPEVVMYRHIHEPPPHPKNFRPDLSDAACQLIFNMLGKRPEDRPASAAQLVSDIEHLLSTGKLPGMFDRGAQPAKPLKVKRDSQVLVNRKRAPKLRGHGMPGQSGPQRPQQPGGQGDAGARLPKKRRKRFNKGW